MIQWLRNKFRGRPPMKKVKLQQVMITVLVESEDDYDVELQESLYVVAQQATRALMRVSDACNAAVVDQLQLGAVPDERGGANVMIAGAPVLATQQNGWTSADAAGALAPSGQQARLSHDLSTRATRHICSRCQRPVARGAVSGEWGHVEPSDHRPPSVISIDPAASASQEDPVINTAVSDRDMGMVDDVSLEELRERPERTRKPPRPRANSWRHGDG